MGRRAGEGVTGLSAVAAACTPLQSRLDARVQEECRTRPTREIPLLAEDDLARLPPPVQRYVGASGAVGRPRVQNFRIEFDAEMYRKPGDAPMVSTSVRCSFVASPTRLFNERDELVDFTSDDRPQLVDGTCQAYRWPTPLEGYQLFDGRRLPTRGAAVYAYPEGPFTCGKFRLKSMAHDVEAPPAS